MVTDRNLSEQYWGKPGATGARCIVERSLTRSWSCAEGHAPASLKTQGTTSAEVAGRSACTSDLVIFLSQKRQDRVTPQA
jgi:hypothetical protein